MTSEHSEPDRDQQFNDVLVACLEAVDNNNAPHLQQLLARHPEFSAELKAFLDAQQQVDRLAAPLRDLIQETSSAGSLEATLDGAPAKAGQAVPADSFGDYELLAEIGSGGMGVVYKARHKSLDRLVALKMVRASELGSTAEVQRFRNEAQILACLEHPHIVAIHEVGEHQGQVYFTMQLVEGGSLDQHLPRFRADGRLSAQLLVAIARAVHHAHQRGVLHRDLKPSNILLDGEGRPHVTDFGLAKQVAADHGLTQSGAIVGTPGYMAPEQASGRPGLVTTAADVYGLGAILYALLTGRPPFHGETILDTLAQVREGEPERPSTRNARVDRDLEAICLKCLEKEPARRYRWAEGVAEDLERWLAGEPIRVRPARLWQRGLKWARRRPSLAALVVVSFLALLALVGAGVGWWYSGQLRTALAEVDQQRKEANRQRARAEEFEASVRYARDMTLAHRAWHDAHVARMAGLLDAWRPTAENPTDRRGWEWFYLSGLLGKHRLTFSAHDQGAAGVAFSPDGRFLATAGRDNKVKVWEAKTGSLVHTLTGHADEVLCVIFSPDGQWVVSSAKDATVRLWQVSTGQCVKTLKTVPDWLRGVAFSRDGRHLAATSHGGGIWLWKTSSWQRIALSGRHRGPVQSVVFTPDSRQMVSAGVDHLDRQVCLWDLATGKEVRRFKGHTHLVNSAVVSPDGKTLATTSEDHMVKLWDMDSGRVLHSLRGHAHWPVQAAFSPDSKQVASASFDSTVKLWDVTTGLERFTLRGQNDALVGVAFSPDGRQVASCSTRGTVMLHDVTSGPPEVRLLAGHKGTVFGVAFDREGRRLVSGSVDGTAKLWDVAGGRVIRTFTGPGVRVDHVALGPDGRLATVGADGVVRFYDADTGQPIPTRPGHQGGIAGLAFHPAGRQLAFVRRDNTVELWDARTGREVRSLGRHSARVRAVAYSPDGGLLVSAGEDDRITFQDPDTGAVRRILRASQDFVSGVAFSPDGETLVSGGQDGSVKFWEVTTGHPLRALQAHLGGVYSVGFHPAGQRLLTMGDDKTIKLWDVASGQETLSLRGHPLGLARAIFSPDGHCIASVGGDPLIRLWETGTERNEQRAK
jgi:WD40 repeat protein/tRNA A-37 threonylcarbamoyl transferase component Bud32